MTHKTSEAEITRRLKALKHPGKTDTINGVRVKREAFRFLLDEEAWAYGVNAARRYIEVKGVRQHLDKRSKEGQS